MVRLCDVCFAFEDAADIPVIDHLSADIKDGEFCVVTGDSGVGKSTLIRLLLKEMEPVSGHLEVFGEDIGKLRPAKIPSYRRKLGVIFQDFKLIEERNVYENLEIARMIYGWSLKATENKIMHVLSFLGIDELHARFPKELSGGEKQKICLARALLNDPRLLLADEPTANLDPAASRDFIRLMDLISRQGITVIMTTHDINTIMDEAGAYHEIKLSVPRKEA